MTNFCSSSVETVSLKTNVLQKKLNEYEATGEESTDYDYYDKWAEAFEKCANGEG